ncbi:ABC transporter ATP-binding protein [Psychromonas sp. CNPT3]|uniref:ABC transporter ATP-binding protein n=1 Tax=Psychromonas sp. CNPT3 TaxID=314282 RepID=UPI00006E425C|nr:ABC transporter ATP-binding protein [Psychromonas sp. CNPT3]AGH81061.1 ABC transporter ATP-binding protein [Psychromonas sp. CNPT3]
MSIKIQGSRPININISDGYLRYYKSDNATLSGLNMCIPAQSWTCLLGKSGCGKSSLLRYIAGLLEKTVHWQGQLQTDPECQLDNEVAYMAQQDLLMPWLSVLDNVLLSTQFLKTSKKEQKIRALSLLESVGLAHQEALFPQQLSGGMRQRVALARTLMQDKPIVLMDEPFSSLDAVTRYRLQNLAIKLLKDKTVLLITHDPQEAIRLADKLYIMQGRPAFVTALDVPSSKTPRLFDAQCATLQQQIMICLENDNE